MYKVVNASGNTLSQATSELEKEVNRLETQGWSCQGSISTSSQPGALPSLDLFFASQAMVK